MIFFKGGLHENTLESFNFTNGWKWHVLCEVRRWWGWCNRKSGASGQGRLWRHWKLLGMKILIKHFKESGLVPKPMLRTQRSHPFPKPEKWLIFAILAKGGPHENFLESFNFTNGWKWHILCKMRRWWRWCIGKVAVTFICWAMSIFISQICPFK